MDDGHKATLEKYYKTYPTAVSTDYDISDSTGSLLFEWTTVGTDDLLMLTWPHHRLTMQNAAHLEPSALAYLTTKVSQRLEAAPSAIPILTRPCRDGCTERPERAGRCSTSFRALLGTPPVNWMSPALIPSFADLSMRLVNSTWQRLLSRATFTTGEALLLQTLAWH